MTGTAVARAGIGPRRSALLLFVLAPLVGEYLLGNMTVLALPWIVLMAPLYGGGALLVREAVRRLGGGWPAIIALAAAYALVEEAVVDQMVFTPRYLDLGSFTGWAPIPGLDASGTLIAASLTMHTIWSITVPIVLVEALSARPTEPWLHWPGTTAVTMLFAIDCLLLGDDQAQKMGFHARPDQYGTSVAAIVVLVGVGVWLARRRRPAAPRPGHVPTPRRAAQAAFAATSAYWIGWMPLAGVESAQWWALGGWVVLVLVSGAVLLRWSRRSGWTDRHRVAVGSGALCTYVWVCPVQSASFGIPPVLALLNWIPLAAAAVMLLVVVGRRTRAADPVTPRPVAPSAGSAPAGWSLR